MLYLCQYTWQPGKSAEEIGRRFMEVSQEQDPALKVRACYVLVGGGAGVIIGETDEPEAINRALMPWMDLVSWDVRAVIETSSDEVMQRIREQLAQ